MYRNLKISITFVIFASVCGNYQMSDSWIPVSSRQELQDCFEKKDVELLKEVIMKMPKEEAEYHMKRCVDSGLWVPGGAEEQGEAGTKAEGKSGVEESADGEEEVYEEVK